MELQVEPITLYRKSPSGKIHTWSISSLDDLITIEWGEEGGSMQTQHEFVEDGLAGRTIDEQVLSRVNSRINKKLDTGYVRDRDIAVSGKAVNTLGLERPMLAAKFKDVKNISFTNAMMQCKYDGHRCLIHFDGTEYTAYSRQGKLIETIPEILEVVSQCGMHPGQTLDGELYHHGTKLQTISSWVKKRQANTKLLSYMVYDVMVPEWHYPSRFGFLSSLRFSGPVQLAPSDPEFSEEQIPHMLEASIKAGYEGLILRQDGFPYQDGKRSKSLIKIKKWEDAEFEVIGIEQSRDGYAVLACIMDNGVEFGCTAPGSMPEKYMAGRQRDQYVGRKVNVQYANLTKEGKPFHPIATGWRDEVE